MNDAEYAEYSDAQDAALERAEARAIRRFSPCQCGTDMPGTCPGPENCPMCEDDAQRAKWWHP